MFRCKNSDHLCFNQRFIVKKLVLLLAAGMARHLLYILTGVIKCVDIVHVICNGLSLTQPEIDISNSRSQSIG